MAQHKKTDTILIILLITMATLYGGVMTQSSECAIKLISMLTCLDYVTGKTLTPSEGCCKELANLVQSQPQCMCEFLKGDGPFSGKDVNQTRASELPMTCNVEIPPTSQCYAESPISFPSDTFNVPSKINSSSDATLTGLASIPALFSLIVAAYAMIFTF